jgi:hypothetical protein
MCANEKATNTAQTMNDASQICTKTGKCFMQVGPPPRSAD